MRYAAARLAPSGPPRLPKIDGSSSTNETGVLRLARSILLHADDEWRIVERG